MVTTRTSKMKALVDTLQQRFEQHLRHYPGRLATKLQVPHTEHREINVRQLLRKAPDNERLHMRIVRDCAAGDAGKVATRRLHTTVQRTSLRRLASTPPRRWLQSGLTSALCLLGAGACAQSANMAEVLASGAKPLTLDEVHSLVVGAKTVFQTVAGSERIWTNHTDGQFVASVADGASGRQFIKSFPGDWKISPEGAYCVRIVYSTVNVDRFCRFLYPYKGAYYAFGHSAKPETMSGRWNFSK